jgi:hypothetical protein
MKAKLLYIILPLYIALSVCACKKFVDISPSPVSISNEQVFKDSATLVAAVNGIYVSMRAATPAMTNGGISIYAGLSADELLNSGGSSLYAPFASNAIPVTQTAIQGMFWSAPYNIIYRTNAILEGLNNAGQLSETLKNQIKGEMLVVRALLYYYLVNLYNDVPLVLTTDYRLSSQTGRTPVAEIYGQLTSDLKFAEGILTTLYPSDRKVRPNNLTASALLARVYLSQKNWPAAQAEAEKVINSGLYNLASLSNVFLINSPETIWEIAAPGEARNSAEGSTFIPASSAARPAFAISSFLLSAFEVNDQRKSSWLKSNTVAGISYYYPYKYKNRAAAPITEYDIVFRLAEQYMILSEALARQSGSTIPQAVSALNKIRLRAGLTALPTTLSQEDCLNAILKERRVELFAEWGHRWIDLKRTGTIDAVLSAEKAGWLPYKALFPIPNNQTLYNNSLTQNPGYNQ